MILLSLSLKIMMKISNDSLWIGNIVTFIISILQTFCIFFVPFLHQRLWQCSDHVLQSYGSSIFFIFCEKWDASWRKLSLNIRYLAVAFICIIKCIFLPFILNCHTYIHFFSCQLEVKCYYYCYYYYYYCCCYYYYYCYYFYCYYY